MNNGFREYLDKKKEEEAPKKHVDFTDLIDYEKFMDKPYLRAIVAWASRLTAEYEYIDVHICKSGRRLHYLRSHRNRITQEGYWMDTD